MRWLALLLAFLPVLAQAQQVDPRLADPMLQAMQAQLALQQAMLKVQAEDAEARQATLWAWFLTQVEAEKKRAEARQ
jgi:hypothetical protein